MRPTFGARSLTAVGANSRASAVMRAVPLMRSVSFIPGTRNSIPIRGLTSRLVMLSSRLLPTRSGIRSVRSSSTRTKPGGIAAGRDVGAVGSLRCDDAERRERDDAAAVLVERPKHLVGRPKHRLKMQSPKARLIGDEPRIVS